MSTLLETDAFECILRRDAQNTSWIAEYPDVPGVSAEGSTKVDALMTAEGILLQWLTSARELGMVVPTPGEARSASGEFKVRLPKSLHARLAALADENRVSLNELNSRLLTASVARTFTGDSYEAIPSAFACKFGPASVGLPEKSTQRDFSGTWVQRVSRVLHLHLQRLAEAEGTSLNAIVIHLLSFELGVISGLRARHVQAERQRAAA